MKKIYLAIAVLATAALSSCVQEKSFNGHVLSDGEVAFVLRTGATTKSIDAQEKGVNVEVGRIGNQAVFLEETVTDLSSITPRTKGTPVFTENVGTLYANKLAVHTNYDGFEDTTFDTEDTEMVNGGWRFFHRYDNVPWPSGEVAFYMYMPSDASGFGEGGFTYDTGSLEFDYTSGVTAEDQQDLIFAYASIDEGTHRDYFSTGGYPVTFYHALSAVKFAIANDATEISNKGIKVTGISITGLMNTGTCTIEFTAGADPTITWEAEVSYDTEVQGDETISTPNVISQSFTPEDNVRDFEKSSDENNFGDTFFSAGTSQNVNTANASKTFWIIPQKFGTLSSSLTHNPTLRISYSMNGKNEYLDIALGTILDGIEWKAGQLRTYTIKLDEVNVMIDDKVNIAGSDEDGYKGSTKTDVCITNTGTTKAFIRAAIVGQWLDYQNNPVFGFTDKINNLYEVESWYEDQFVNNSRNHGKFVNLPGYDVGNPDHGWQLCEDGYYYYLSVVDPGKTIGTAPSGASNTSDYLGNPLFTSYTVGTIPNAQIAGQEIDHKEMHFRLEISTQAVTAVKMDGHEGSLYDWDEAWEHALGTKPVKKTDY